MRRVEKVHAYITHGDKILVFRQPEFPEVGLQIPGGTVEPGENLEVAVLREVHEETGLTEARIVALLGVYEFDMRPYREELQQRHVFHLELHGFAQKTWDHHERAASGGHPPILFAFEWMRLNDPALRLAGGQGELLHLLSE